MAAHRIFAQIYEDKVQNVIVCNEYDLANQLAIAAYGNTAVAIDGTFTPCDVGDMYQHGVFWKAGKQVAAIPDPTHVIPLIAAKVEYLSMMSGIDLEVGDE